jgi:hypothetical protein
VFLMGAVTRNEQNKSNKTLTQSLYVDPLWAGPF